MPRWRYTVTDPVPTHLMCTAKIDTISITAKNKHPSTKEAGSKVIFDPASFHYKFKIRKKGSVETYCGLTPLD